WLGSIIGFFSGMFTGHNNVNRDNNALAQAQREQSKLAEGVAMGVTMAKLEDLEQRMIMAEQQKPANYWVNAVGGHQKAIDPQTIREQQMKMALAGITPQGNA